MESIGKVVVPMIVLVVGINLAVQEVPKLLNQALAMVNSVTPTMYALCLAVGLASIPLGAIVHHSHSPKWKAVGKDIAIAGVIGAILGAAGVGSMVHLAHAGGNLLNTLVGGLG